jgi:transketolase
VAALAAPSEEARDGRPLFVMANTNPTKGIKLFEERAPKLHYCRFQTEEDYQKYKKDYERLEKEAGLWR